MTVHPNHTPNTLAYDYVLDSGTVVTVYRAVPGDTKPRMQMRLPGMTTAVDCGEVEAPERFGPYETTEEFRDWAEKFAANA